MHVGTTRERPLHLWAGLQSSARVAVVIGPRHSSMSDAWPLPPSDGLVLAGIDAENEALDVFVNARWAGELPEPPRVAIEPLPKPSAARVERWARAQFNSRHTLVWLTRATQTIDQHPQVVDPKSADDLWDAGDLPPTAAS
jgi:hypothetical protein